jgi:hypothetical protein
MGSSSDECSPAREMCMEVGGGRGRRGGGGSRSAADGGRTAKQKQPQRGLGVAQLEKIRLHNQMLAAYRSATRQPPHDHPQQQPQGHDVVVDAATHFQLVPPPRSDSSSFQTYHHRGVVQYYGGMYSRTATSPPSLYAHDVRDSSGHRLGPPPPQQHYCMTMMSSSSSRSDDGACSAAEELDLELRL